MSWYSFFTIIYLFSILSLLIAIVIQRVLIKKNQYPPDKGLHLLDIFFIVNVVIASVSIVYLLASAFTGE